MGNGYLKTKTIKVIAKPIMTKKIMPMPATSIFHAAAGTGNEGMYHPNNISADGKALVPNPGVARNFIQKKADATFIKQADKKLKGFKFGQGVGP